MKVLFALLMMGISGFVQGQLPQVCCGRIERLTAFASKQVDARNVDVWLPNKYDPTKKYAVLYMHDGQMLFDATQTWNKLAWEVDETAQKLIDADQVIPFIIVGIWNNGEKRHPEYFPQKPFESLTIAQKQYIAEQLQAKGRIKGTEFQPISDHYLTFMVTELKPYIDSHFSTLPDAAHTAIAGSSMGGLISWYALCEYPKVFGQAACLSTHWPGIFNTTDNPIPAAFRAYLSKKIPKPKKGHRFYFDYGDQTLDALYPDLQKAADVVFTEKGYTEKNYKATFFPGADHSETAWSKRFDQVLLFLFGRKQE